MQNLGGGLDEFLLGGVLADEFRKDGFDIGHGILSFTQKWRCWILGYSIDDREEFCKNLTIKFHKKFITPNRSRVFYEILNVSNRVVAFGE